jgi:short-subunit dehydrogenase
MRRRRESLAGRCIWITGASAGIGRALAAELHRRGARVAVSARTAEALAELAEGHPGMLAVPADVTVPASVHEAVGRIRDRLGPIDIAVLNAGTYTPVRPDNFSIEVFRPQVEVNIMGTVACIEAVLPAMLARRSGRIAVVASVTGFAALPLASAYGASKAFLLSMCDSLRADLAGAGTGVEVTAIAPGFVRTGLTEQNEFAMPFVIEADEAARTIADGLEAGDAEIAFPRRMSAAMKGIGRFLPGPLRRRYIAGIARRRHRERTRA